MTAATTNSTSFKEVLDIYKRKSLLIAKNDSNCIKSTRKRSIFIDENIINKSKRAYVLLDVITPNVIFNKKDNVHIISEIKV